MRVPVVVIVIVGWLAVAVAQEPAIVIAVHATSAPTIDGVLDEPIWRSSPIVTLDHDWHGVAFTALETHARLAWTADALFVAFDGTFDSTVDAPSTPTTSEAEHLYGHDALEVFVDLEPASPRTYFEIELGPAGHFLDVAVDLDRRPHGDTSWSSGVVARTTVDTVTHRFAIEARIPSASMQAAPLAAGDARIGVFRIGRAAGTRFFLARFPTMTTRPNFHVPDRFGTLRLAP